MDEPAHHVPDYYEALATHRAASIEAKTFVAYWGRKLALEGLTPENLQALAKDEAALSPLALCLKQKADPRRGKRS